MLKVCNCCNQEKSVSFFFRDGRYKAEVLCGYRQPCITCTSENRRDYNRKYRKTKKGSAGKKISARQSYRNNRTARAVANRKFKLKRLYGITLEDYNILVTRQNGGCALCGIGPQIDTRYGGIKLLGIDHLHGHHPDSRVGCKECIRGLLCNTCNKNFLPQAERYPELRNPKIDAYLASRPLSAANTISPALESSTSV